MRRTGTHQLDDFTANPYWVLNRITSKEKRDRIMASITGKAESDGLVEYPRPFERG